MDAPDEEPKLAAKLENGHELEKGCIGADGMEQVGSCSEDVHLKHRPVVLIYKRLLGYGVETRGIHPIPVEERLDSKCSTPFFVWFSSGACILTFSTGSLGPLAFGLSTRNSCLVILLFNLLCATPAAYLATWGPKLGLRQMIHARYVFGYFGAVVPAFLNAFTSMGFTVLAVILGGQTLASVQDDGSLSWSTGIVIISVVALLLCSFGHKFISWFGRAVSIPMCIAMVIALGMGGKKLVDPPTEAPASAVQILTFASAVSGFALSFSPLAMDFTCSMRPETSSWRLFLSIYLGIFTSVAAFMCFGAIFSAAALVNADWHEGLVRGNVGGLLAEVFRPAGAFGKILVVLLSLSLASGMSAVVYSTYLNAQTFLPVLHRVPRVVFSALVMAVVVPLGILASQKFQETLTNFLALIASWVSAFTAIILVEHLVFRRSSFSAYDLSQWDTPRKLPSGISALTAGVVGMGLAVPCINQAWYVGPIAKHTGDIGFEVAFVASAAVYALLRRMERWFLSSSVLDE